MLLRLLHCSVCGVNTGKYRKLIGLQCTKVRIKELISRMANKNGWCQVADCIEFRYVVYVSEIYMLCNITIDQQKC